MTIFRTLMSTRAANVTAQHVEALNAVPVEFYGSSGKLKKINNAWKLYLDHHDPQRIPTDAWAEKRRDLFLDLLHLMSEFLGFEFTRSQLGTDIYSPRALGDLESDMTIIRKGMVSLLNGEITLQMAVKEFPATADAETLEAQALLHQLLAAVLSGEKPLVVKSANENDRGGVFE